MNNILWGLDPGTMQSALVGLRSLPNGRVEIAAHCTMLNGDILAMLRKLEGTLVIEQIQSYGMAVGQDVFTTVFWSGRFYEAWTHGERHQLPRGPIKIHLCGSMKAKDANIRAALLDKFGGATAIGKKHTPGPLYGVKGHEFAALAVAVVWLETSVASVA